MYKSFPQKLMLLKTNKPLTKFTNFQVDSLKYNVVLLIEAAKDIFDLPLTQYDKILTVNMSFIIVFCECRIIITHPKNLD